MILKTTRDASETVQVSSVEGMADERLLSDVLFRQLSSSNVIIAAKVII